MDVAGLRHVFATRIRKLRGEKMTQGEFADSVGVSRGAMSYYEQEARTPDIGVLRSICGKYGIPADYLLGLTADPNHAVADICRETGLSAEAARRLRLITRIVDTDFRSFEHMAGEFDGDLPDAMKLTAFTSIPELLSVLLESDEGLSLLNLLGAIILGAEIENGGQGSPKIKLKSASRNFRIAVPIENITSALWVNIQDEAAALRKKLQPDASKPE
jgi:transcriptional regulator with XRE-family HTH domain